jgi:YbbR domain-containing protein
MIVIPSNLSLETIKPDSIQIGAYRLLQVDVPIEVSCRGELPRGRILQRIEVSPPSVTLLVPPALRDKGMKISTEVIDLSQLTQTTVFVPKLLFPPEVRFVDPKPPGVKVTLEIREKSGMGAPQKDS